MINGEKVAGVSIIELDEGIDTGPILAETTFPISATDTIATLHNKANASFAILMIHVLHSFEAGPISSRPQDEYTACYWHQRSDSDGHLRATALTVVEADRFVRALGEPYPGAFVYLNGARVRLYEASQTSFKLRGVAGRVCYVQGDGPYLVLTDGAIRLDRYEIEGHPDLRLRAGDLVS